MVFSEELGYDPEEWEECPPPDHFLAFGLFTRIVLAIGAIIFAFLFFYVLEKRKDWAREERRASFSAINVKPEELDELIKRTERERHSASQQGHNSSNVAQSINIHRSIPATHLNELNARRPRKRMSEMDMAALLEWNRELKELERRRLEEAKEMDKRVAPSLRASAPPQQLQYTTYGSQSPGERSPPPFGGGFAYLKQADRMQQGNFDSPVRAPTPPSTPPTGPSPPQESQLQAQAERLALELQQKLAEEIQQAQGTNRHVLQQQLRDKHSEAIMAAESNLREQGVVGIQVAQQFRRQLEDQLDSMVVEEYNRHLSHGDLRSYNESDADHFEQISASHVCEADEPDNEGASFIYEASPKPQNSGSKHATVPAHRQVAHLSEVPVIDQNMPDTNKKSSSSSEDGFVKVYTDLVDKIDEDIQHSKQYPSPTTEAQLMEILQEYNVQAPAESGKQQESPMKTTTLPPPSNLKDAPLIEQLSPEKPKSPPHDSRPSSSCHSSDIEEMLPTQLVGQVSVPLVPLAGFQGNFLQQYQQGPDGRLYPQGPDGLFYGQNRKGQFIPMSDELQNLLQQQQQSGLQPPLIRTTDGGIYQQGPNGQFYQQAADGEMYKVPPSVQKLIQQEIQQSLQMGERGSNEPRELVKGPDGLTYERGPVGQFYEQGPDGKLHRVSLDIQRQLLDLVEERKQEEEKKKDVKSKKPSVDPHQKKPKQPGSQNNLSIIQSPDGKIYELTSDGTFYQLGGDGHLYRIPNEMQPILQKQHKMLVEQKQKQAELNKSVEEETPPFDPEYPYHPRRPLPMQPNPNAPKEEPKRPELKRQQQNEEQTPPVEPEKPRPLGAEDVHQVRELLQEYDLSASLNAPHSQYDQPSRQPDKQEVRSPLGQQPDKQEVRSPLGQQPDKQETRSPLGQQADKQETKLPLGQQREHRPSPEDVHQLLQTPEIRTGHTTPDSALDFDILHPGEVEAELRSHPSPSQSSGQLQQKQHLEHDEHRSATQPPPEHRPHDVHRDTSEQSHKQRQQEVYLEQHEDPRRLVEADIYVQDAIDYVESQNQQNQAEKAAAGFIIEEDMLSSSDRIPAKMQNASADPTSRLVPTNEVFEKPETTGFEDADVTFAPDIQTAEIPPDQLSQNSSNYIDNMPDEMIGGTDEEDQFTKQASPRTPPEPQSFPKQAYSKPEDAALNTQDAPAPLQLERHRISIQLAQQIGPPKEPEEDEGFGVSSATFPTGIEHRVFAAVTSPTSPGYEADAVDPFSNTDHTSAGPREIGSTTKDEQIFNDDSNTEHLLRMRPVPREISDSPFDFKEEQQPSAPRIWTRRKRHSNEDTTSVSSSKSSRASTSRSIQKQSSLLSVLGCTSIQEMLLGLTSLEELSEAMKKAGLERTNLIFGIDYTASNKYQGEHSFDGRSLHFVGDPEVENPYQQVIKVMGHSLAPFASSSTGIPAYGFGDNESGDWGVFPLNGKTDGVCKDLDEVLRVYNEITPNISLGGPTNFSPLIYQAIQICQRVQDYHILVVIADGQVTNERATRKAIVQACQFPLSIIVVGVGDGPWEMMKVFDESLPKRPWDNFHFVEYHKLVSSPYDKTGELTFAIHTLLEVPDQYHHISKLGMIPCRDRQSTPLQDSPPHF